MLSSNSSCSSWFFVNFVTFASPIFSPDSKLVPFNFGLHGKHEKAGLAAKDLIHRSSRILLTLLLNRLYSQLTNTL